MLTETHLRCVCESLSELLGAPTKGAMAYARCLSAGALERLRAALGDSRHRWTAYVVGSGVGEATITADRAVELRELKGDAVLLLVDPQEEGAGMSGIYSAVREITEAELLRSAEQKARHGVPHGRKMLLDRAVSTARRLGRRKGLAPWLTFDFWARCADTPDEIGQHVACLGLWPIAEDVNEGNLALAAKVTERLLLSPGQPRARVATLHLRGDAGRSQEAELAAFLRESDVRGWMDSVVVVVGRPQLWLGAIEPDPGKELRAIALRDWRQKSGRPYAWSGLKAVDDLLEFRIPPDSSDACHLEIRWTAEPEGLPAGAAEYLVEILTGGDTVLLSREVPHRDVTQQKCVFSREAFDDLDEGGTWEVVVRVSQLGHAPGGGESCDDGEGPLSRRSEDLVLTFGETDEPPKESAGKVVDALVEDAIRLGNQDDFASACVQPLQADKAGYVRHIVDGSSARVRRPHLVAEAERDWDDRGYPIGRWLVSVRDDGSRAGPIRFLGTGIPSDKLGELPRRTQTLARQAAARAGFVAMIYRDSQAATDYVNAWVRAIEQHGTELALANTVEVQDLRGHAVGLLVLPSHAIRVAWHQAYDELAYHARYVECLEPAEVTAALRLLDGSHFPAFLPAPNGAAGYVFGDMVGFHVAAMIPQDAPEPQASIAQLARCAAGSRSDAPSPIGEGTSDAIAAEIGKYCRLHPQYPLLEVHALQPGDGMTIARSLGAVLRGQRPNEEDDTDLDAEDAARPVGGTLRRFELSLFPSQKYRESSVVGRFLSDVAEGHRSGSRTIGQKDRWMHETTQQGVVRCPNLRWAKRDGPDPERAAHLSVAFDLFGSRLEPMPSAELALQRPREGYGLFPSLHREYCPAPEPQWTATVAPSQTTGGEKHPAGAALTDRLAAAQNALARAAAGDAARWPVLRTRVDADTDDRLRMLHERSDWVITVDRNAGLEYFDAPKDNPEVYDTYVIDCVPERQDLDCVRLITSTSRVAEVTRLLYRALDEMDLSRSERNCRCLLDNLKALSGRLAMRSSQLGDRHGELIALALLYKSACESQTDERWPTVSEGFLVPLDDVPDLLPAKRARLDAQDGDAADEGDLRADLLHVSAPKRGGLAFRFIEVKYRRLVTRAREAAPEDRP